MNSSVEPLHIAFGVDRNYVPAMGVTMISIVENNPQLNIVFHVLVDALPPEDLEIIQRLETQLSTSIRVHRLDADRLALVPPHATYYRFFLCDILKDEASHVLYLDADITCLRNIYPLPELGEAVAAVVLDVDQADRNAGINRPASTPYFNAGVMYVDIKRWNGNDVTNKSFALLATRRFQFHDQDILNLVLANQVLLIDRKWNRLRDAFSSANAITADTIFLHYAGDKPWHAWRKAFLDPPFAKYFKKSPWPAARLLTPRTRKNKLQYAKHLLKQGNLFNGMLWYIRYLSTPKRLS